MLNNQFELIGVGSPIVDILARVPDSFLANVGGEKGGMVLVDPAAIAEWKQQLGDDFTQSAGGSAGNVAFAAARLGLRTTFLGKLGNDDGAAFYKESFEAWGGDSKRFKRGDVPNGTCLSLITPDSERTLRTDLGAAATLRPDEITALDFAGCRHAHIEGYLLFNPDLMMAVLEAAKSAGCTISLDLASFEVVEAAGPRLPEILRNYIDLVFANELEAAAFCGDDLSLAEMSILLGKYCDLAVVKAGARGAWLARGHNILYAPAIDGITAIDTTGAGDFWAAGFLSGYLKGLPLGVCAARGARLGAEIVQQIGTELPEDRWETVLASFKG